MACYRNSMIPVWISIVTEPVFVNIIFQLNRNIHVNFVELGYIKYFKRTFDICPSTSLIWAGEPAFYHKGKKTAEKNNPNYFYEYKKGNLFSDGKKTHLYLLPYSLRISPFTSLTNLTR